MGVSLIVSRRQPTRGRSGTRTEPSSDRKILSMIVLRQRDRLRLVTQTDHAAFAAELLSLCRLPGLVDHPRRTELLRALRHHDNGWRELDAAPACDPESGLPYTFLDLPPARRLEIWERGTARHLDDDPYTALLTTHHALTLLAGAGDSGDRSLLLRRLEEHRRELLVRCDLDAERLAADYRFLDLGDRLSLIVCNGWRRPLARHGITARLGEAELFLSPFPLAGATTFAVPCRWIPARRYAGDADLAVTLAGARWESFAQRVVAGG